MAKEVKTKKVVEKKVTKKLALSISPNTLIKKPHVTEKSAKANEKNNVYTFIVHKDANKTEIAKAIIMLYDVMPVKVRVLNIKPSIIVKRGKKGTQKGYRKAIVTIAQGQSIAFA
jgi:large subunit ribosomal protein L23